MKILLAEDERISRLTLSALLASWGYEVQAVEDGMQAWEILVRPNSPRLAILDWIMPRMDGLEVVRKVRARAAPVPIYIILLTGQDSREDTIRGLEAGADEYVIKPFNSSELHARIRVGERVLQLQETLSRRVEELENALRARKKAEDALMQQRHLLDALMDNVPDAIFFKDGESRFTRVNRSQARWLGMTDPEAVVGKTAVDFFGNELAQPVRADELEIIRTGSPIISKEEKETRPDGREAWISITKMPLRAPDGQIIGTFGISRDITERKQAEETLRSSEERVRLLFATIPHPVWVYDLETLDFLEVNDAAIAHYGYSRGEFLRMKITDIRPPEDVRKVLQAARAARPPMQSSGQWKHCLKDGRTIDVEVRSHLIDFEGRKAVLVVAQDITEQKRLEVELRHSQRLEAVGSLAAGIAHELNTPIQFVGDNVRFLEGAFTDLGGLIKIYQGLRDAAVAGTLDGERLQAVRQAEKAADLDYLAEEVPKAITQSLDGVERVATIVRAMKDFAHPDRSEKIAADLNKALESTLTVARNELKYVADVETDFGELPLVPCHLGDLNQVFLNLLVNAAHAIGDVVKDTGKKGRIRVTTRHEGALVTVAIEDTGCGIPAEIRERIFDPFFTTKEIGRGTGQGLAIARSIVVEKHGGTLTFQSEVGRGSAFVVRLPLEGVAAAEETLSA